MSEAEKDKLAEFQRMMRAAARAKREYMAEYQGADPLRVLTDAERQFAAAVTFP